MISSAHMIRYSGLVWDMLASHHLYTPLLVPKKAKIVPGKLRKE